MIARRPMSVTVACLCAVVGCMVLGVAAAPAATTHNLLFQFNEIPAGPGVANPGLLRGDNAITVDSGHLWVAEPASGTNESRVDEFNAENGQFMHEVAHSEETQYRSIAVGHATGEGQVYVGFEEQSSHKVGVLVFSESGAPLPTPIWTGVDTPGGNFGEYGNTEISVATDGSPSLSDWAAGDVYVGVNTQKVVDVFRPEAGGKEEYLTQLTGTCATLTACTGEEAFKAPTKVAVNSANGDVVVLDEGNIDLFEPTLFGEYVFVRTITSPSSKLVFQPPGQADQAVNASDGQGDIFVLDGTVENGEVQPEQVLEFDATGAYLGRIAQTGQTKRAMFSVAADPSTHDVFVGLYENGEPPGFVNVYGPNIVIPSVATAPASEAKGDGAGRIVETLNGTVNPAKAGEATCRFVWGPSVAFGETVSCVPATISEGETPQPVHAVLSGLAPDTTYYNRVQASNKNGTNLGEPWQNEEFTTPGPGLRGEGTSAVRSDSVTFDAKISPHGANTSYYFQYGSTSTYENDLPAQPGVALGSGVGDLEVSQHAQGLSASTTYHYRVVVVSELVPGEVESFYGPDQTFTTQGIGVPTSLPDGRAWEMVSPPQKEGALLGWIGGGGLIQGSATGNAFVDWADYQATEENPPGAANLVPVYFGRGSGGWTSKVIAPPHTTSPGDTIGMGHDYWAFSEDLSKGLLQPYATTPPLSPQATEETPYLRTDYSNGNGVEPCLTGCYEPLVTAANVSPGVKFGHPREGCGGFCGPLFLGSTPDLSHVVLESPLSLTPGSGADGEGEKLYEWTGGNLTYIGLGALGLASADARHAISSDGTRVIFTGQSEGLAGLLARDTAHGNTVRLDLPQAEAAGGSSPAEFQTASADGSRVFFADASQLTSDSSAVNNEADLYEYNFDAPLGSRLTDLSADQNPGERADVKFVLGASEDGSSVYFAAGGALAPGATAGKCGGNSPKLEGTQLCNLYVHNNGKTTFIASLSAEDFPDWGASTVGALGTGLEQTTDRVSPDGRWLAFMSNRNLTGYDTTDAVSHRPAEEVYLYDARAGKLVCASCNPTGARPVGRVEDGAGLLVGVNLVFSENTWIAASVPPWTGFRINHASYQSRYLSNSGRLFFDSNDALVPQDVNGTGDVYEYEPPGIGGCGVSSQTFSARSGGCVAPVSSGTSNEESAFLDASENGSDVFFLTSAKLSSQDVDNAIDIYDAHECSVQSPCIASPSAAPPPCDNGEACKAAQSPQPEAFGAAPSQTFSGAGNVLAPVPGVGLKSLTRAQKLTRALKACHAKKRGRPRAACERLARKRYGRAQSRKADATRKGRG
jgi:hypothetical protein